jgi:hypothetical protein
MHDLAPRVGLAQSDPHLAQSHRLKTWHESGHLDVFDTENMNQTLDSFYACCWCLMPVPQLCVWHTTHTDVELLLLKQNVVFMTV